MPKRNIYHVTPGQKGDWDVKKEGGKRSSGHYDRKADVVDRGRNLQSQDH